MQRKKKGKQTQQTVTHIKNEKESLLSSGSDIDILFIEHFIMKFVVCI